MMNRLLLLFFSAQVCPVQAAETVALKSDDRMPGLADVATWGLSLIIVLGLFFACVWLIRKSGQFTPGGKPIINVVAGLSLGMREKVVLLNVGDKQLLLGVTPGRINKLLELEGDQRLLPAASGGENNEFARRLKQVMQGGKHD